MVWTSVFYEEHTYCLHSFSRIRNFEGYFSRSFYTTIKLFTRGDHNHSNTIELSKEEITIIIIILLQQNYLQQKNTII